VSSPSKATISSSEPSGAENDEEAASGKRRTTVEVVDLYHEYGSRAGDGPAVDRISLEVEEGEFFALLGPSGCGKTTTLRCMAGLEKPKGGTIKLNGKSVVSSKQFVPTYKRDIGMVFQDYAIWPHMTVFENVAFPLRATKQVPRATIRAAVDKTLEIVGLGHLAERPTTQLSGGQQQRVALARALVGKPALLLLDEPLSNLDASLREQMRTELRQIQRQLNVTALLVTHDQVEAMSMASRIALMNQGEIVQISTPEELYHNPTTRFAAAFIGPVTFYDGTVAARDAAKGEKALIVDTALGKIRCLAGVDAEPGSKVTVAIRPESILVHRSRPTAQENVSIGAVANAMFVGGTMDLQIKAGGHELRATVPSRGWLPVVGDDVHVELMASGCIVLVE
jgi:iron(III) transport system ATP-binding protein